MENNEQKIATMEDLVINFISRDNKIKEKIDSEKEILIFSQPISTKEYHRLCSYKEQGFNIEKIGKYVKISRTDSKLKIFVLYFENSLDSLKYFFLNMNPCKAFWNIFLILVLIYVWFKIIEVWALISLLH